jgi:hypothetical protein
VVHILVMHTANQAWVVPAWVVLAWVVLASVVLASVVQASVVQASVALAWARPVGVGLLQKVMPVQRELSVVVQAQHLVQALSSQCHMNILLVYPLKSRQAYKICHIEHN